MKLASSRIVAVVWLFAALAALVPSSEAYASPTITPAALADIEAMKTQNASHFLILKIVGNTIVVDKKQPSLSPNDHATFVNALSAVSNEPRLALLGFSATLSSGGETRVLFLVSWTPGTSPVRLKMTYTTAAENLKKQISGIQKTLTAATSNDLAEAKFKAVLGL